MKKKSTSQSAPCFAAASRQGGFLNLRVLFGLFLMLAGVFLALVSFGPATRGFAQETTRAEMTLALAQALNIQPPSCLPGPGMFHDVPVTSPFCPYIQELARQHYRRLRRRQLLPRRPGDPATDGGLPGEDAGCRKEPIRRC
jgi:hypothetical protein